MPFDIKANDNCLLEPIILPIPEIRSDAKTEMEIYARFMRHLRIVTSGRMEIRILASIQFVADMLDLSDADVTCVLVDMGLRAPRMALPADFLDDADRKIVSDDAPDSLKALRALKEHWDEIGEDRFAAFRKFYPSLTIGMFET